jgi:hypothetical protein
MGKGLNRLTDSPVRKDALSPSRPLLAGAIQDEAENGRSWSEAASVRKVME